MSPLGAGRFELHSSWLQPPEKARKTLLYTKPGSVIKLSFSGCDVLLFGIKAR